MDRDAAINVRNVRPDIRAAVVRDAQDRTISVNDTVGEILAAHYGLSWETAAYGATESTSQQWYLRMPSVLKHTIQAHAEKAGGKQTGVILWILARHYGLPNASLKSRRAVPPLPVTKKQMEKIRARVGAGESIRKLEREYGLTRGTLNRTLRREEI